MPKLSPGARRRPEPPKAPTVQDLSKSRTLVIQDIPGTKVRPDGVDVVDAPTLTALVQALGASTTSHTFRRLVSKPGEPAKYDEVGAQMVVGRDAESVIADLTLGALIAGAEKTGATEKDDPIARRPLLDRRLRRSWLDALLKAAEAEEIREALASPTIRAALATALRQQAEVYESRIRRVRIRARIDDAK